MRTSVKHKASQLLPVALILFLAVGLVGYCTERQSVISSTATLTPPPYAPLTLTRFDLATTSVEFGAPLSLLNGVCISGNQPLIVEVWLGAQSESTDPLIDSTSITLLGLADTPEGRERRTVLPGCSLQEPFVLDLPVNLSPATWRLQLHLVVRGPNNEMQNVVAVSEPFVVLEAE